MIWGRPRGAPTVIMRPIRVCPILPPRVCISDDIGVEKLHVMGVSNQMQSHPETALILLCDAVRNRMSITSTHSKTVLVACFSCAGRSKPDVAQKENTDE